MRKLLAPFILLAALIASPALADWTGKDAAGATVTFKNPGTCTSVVCVPVAQLYDGTNVVTLTTAGADAASNTLTGLPTYSRMQVFNGTTWDRWQGAVTATLGAETTKVIGTVRIASGGVASGSYVTGAFASGSVASGAMVDLGAQADSAAAADNSTASLIALVKRTNQNLTTLNTTAGTSIPAGGNTIGTVKIVGNAGAFFDQATGSAVPANAIYWGLNVAGNLRGATGVNPSGSVFAAQTDITSVNGVTVLTGTGATGTGAQRVTVATDSATIAGSVPGTAGTASTNVVTIQGIASMTKLLVTPDANSGINLAQVNGVTTLAGTGATGTGAQRVTVSTDQATNAGAALKTGGVGVVNGGSDYETVAASQTGQSLGATGATGDYLSHCVIYPTTTTPGVVTVFDNTNAAGTNAIAFPGGASSVSNLAPIAIPVGAISTAGAWKVTTGANLVVTCYGKFT